MRLIKKLITSFQKDSFLVLISLLCLILGLILGFLFSLKQSDITTQEVYIPDNAIKLFANNISAMGNIAIGFFSFGIISIILLISNGVFIGLTVSEKLSSGMSILEIIIKILPHGIFEIPAIIASGVIGLKSMKLLIRVLSSQKKFSEEFVIMVKDIFVLLIVVIFLTIISSIIEIYITP